MDLAQDIEFLKMFTFNCIEEMNKNSIIQKYFSITNDGQGAMEHIFKGFQVENGLFNGYHSEYLFPNLYKSSLDVHIDKSKPYALNLNMSGKRYNTFFPITMSCENIIIAILLAYKNSNIKPEKHNYTYYVEEYDMYVNICMTKDFKIYDAYPVIKN